MTADQFQATRKHLEATWNGTASLPKRDLQLLIDEIRWLKRRLHPVEDAIAPLVESVRRGRMIAT